MTKLFQQAQPFKSNTNLDYLLSNLLSFDSLFGDISFATKCPTGRSKWYSQITWP